jgi:hypothetical protein
MEPLKVKIPITNELLINREINVSGGSYKKTIGSPSITNNPEYFSIKKQYLTMIEPFREKESDQFIGGMPIQIESDCIKQLIRVNKYTNQLVYSMTLKADGERYLLFINTNHDVYLIDRSTDIYYLKNYKKIPNDIKTPLLLDGELIEHSTGKFEYIAFDILFYPDKLNQVRSCILQNFSIRYSILNEVVNIISPHFPCTLKKWFPITDILLTPNIYRYITNETNKDRKKRGLVALKSDGIILQPNDGVYVTFREWNKYNNVQFKWKPSDQLTIDFQIKVISKNEWVLLSNTGMPYMIQQPKGRKPEPATCFPTPKEAALYSDNDVVEFTFQEKENPQRNLFNPSRLRNEKRANGYKTIMSTMNSIENPFNLEQLKDPIKVITSNEIKTKEGLKKVLSVFTKSDLILMILNKNKDLFFNQSDIQKIKKIYNILVGENLELEFRIFTNTKKNIVIDKTNFYYLLDFLWDSFEHSYSETIDIYLNKIYPNKKKYRSTYNSIEDVLKGKSLENIAKQTLESFTSKYEAKLYNDLGFKLDISSEEPSGKLIKLKNQIDNEVFTNMIRSKKRYSFYLDLWRIDLTRIKTGYVLDEIASKNDTYECECEFIGPTNISFEVFLKSMNDVYMLILSNSSYC